MTLLASFFLLVALGTALWLRLSFRPSRLGLDAPAVGGRQPLVSLVIPMRNEEQNLDCCLGSVRHQDYPQLQVIVVDDNSTDGTAAALARWKSEWPELELVQLEERPPGWAGKTHPVHRGAERARGEWILFLDADVELGPQAVSRVVAVAESRGWPMVSLMGRLKVGSFWEVVLQLYMWALFLALRVEFPRSALVGAFTLIRTSVYREIGGYAAFPGAVSSDVALADLLVSRGIEPRVRLCPEAYACRMYTSLQQVWQGCTRMMAGGTGFRGSIVATCGFMLLLLDGVPLATLLWLALAHGTLGTREWFLAGAATLAVLVRWYAYQRLLARMSAPAWAFVTKPLSDVATILLFADAAWRISLGHVTWKGRRYTKSLVRRQGVRAAPVTRAMARGRHPNAPALTVVTIVRGQLGTQGGAPALPRRDFEELTKKHPAVEFLVVAPPGIATAAGLPSLRSVVAPSADRFVLLRRGLEEARGQIVAFRDADSLYSDDWLTALAEAFADPHAGIVAGRTLYAGEGAFAKAGTLRDWGNPADPQSLQRHLPETNFAARRELLLYYDFADGFCEWGGTLALATLAAYDGVEIRYEPRMTARAPNLYSAWGPARDRLLARHSLVAELVRRDLLSLDFRSLTARFMGRFLPVFVWFSTAVGAAHAYRSSRAALGIGGAQRLSVPVALVLLADWDWLLAQVGVLRPAWLARHGQRLGSALAPEVDSDPAHPLLSKISRITWALAVGIRTPLPLQAAPAGSTAQTPAPRS